MVLISLSVDKSSGTGRTFAIDYENGQFLKDGKPFRFVSGSIHYFRVPREYWKDRLYKMKLAGLTAISTYIEWSGHEPESGVYYFGGDYDVEAFLKIVDDLGLLVILRPGPYICGERDNGGLPYWLLREDPKMVYRTSDTNYTALSNRWLDVILPRMVPYLYNNGGPVILVQAENEYGNYKVCDLEYMKRLFEVFRKHLGPETILFRADYPSMVYYNCDYVADALVAGCVISNTDVNEALSKMAEAQPKKKAPAVVVEFYNGWMDYWGYTRSPTRPDAVMPKFRELMDRNASVNFYVFHGGTNFGFRSATCEGKPLVTSYDYGAPLSEAGDPTPYYHMIRDDIAKYLPVPSGELPIESRKMIIPNIELTESISLFEVMEYFRKRGWLRNATSKDPLTFEELGQNYGFLVYRTKVNFESSGAATLTLIGLRDRAYIFDKRKWSLLYFKEKINETKVTIEKGEELTIVVENMGREMIGKENHDPKGIRKVMFNGEQMTDWITEAVPITRDKDITELMRLFKEKGEGQVPGFFHGTFKVPEENAPLDTFLDPTGWRKGVAFVNGINLGRYWPDAGPQVTLYLPAPYLLPYPEENHLFLFELERAPGESERNLVFTDTPKLGVSS